MVFTIMSVTMMKSVTFTTLRSTVPSVRVRCTRRTAASGDAWSACVSVTSCFFFTPVTMRVTTRSMTKCSTQRMRNAIAMITTIETSLPTMIVPVVGPELREARPEVAAQRLDGVDGFLSTEHGVKVY